MFEELKYFLYCHTQIHRYMKKILLFALLAFIISCFFVAAKITIPAMTATKCVQVDDPYALLDDLWKHVYHPDRLTVNEKKKMISGTINARKKEPDGDWHIQVKLDKQYESMLNDYNNNVQNGCLVVEIICYNTVTQTDAEKSCQSCPKSISVPKVGAHVKIYGSYITDTEANHGWNEIHPVCRIEPYK